MCRTGIRRFGVGNWIFLLATFHLFTYAQGAEEILRFAVEPSDVVVPAGGRVVLPCSAGGATVRWRHSDRQPTADHEIAPGGDRKQLSNGSLVIERLTTALAGQYQCVATAQGVGTIVSRVATVFLAEVPELIPGPRSVLAISGEAVLLPCSVRVSPRMSARVMGAAPDSRAKALKGAAPPELMLNVTWTVNGSPVVLNGRGALSASGALELEPALPHDQGLYRCSVALYSHPHVNRLGEEIELQISTVSPNVESAPRFIAKPQSVTIMEGASVTFDCAAVGNPKPEIIWLNNGVAIDLNDLDSRVYLTGAGSLRVLSARPLDAGAYTCRAHNRLDSEDHTAHLNVMSPPRVHLPDAPLVTAQARGDVLLKCVVKGRPTPTVHWLKDGEPITPNNHDIAIVDGASLRIRGVLSMDSGMFQCSAASLAGTAQAALRLHTHKADTNATDSKLDSIKNAANKNHMNKAQDIFNSLVSSSPLEDELDSDFLGEVSSAFTSNPEYTWPDPDTDYDNDLENLDSDYFHAAQDLDLEDLPVNASVVSTPKNLRAVIVKHRFVTLSWSEPDVKLEEIVGYAVVFKVKGSERERVSRSVGDRHEMNVPSLQPNTTYMFTARAYSKRTQSPPTEVLEVSTPPEEVSFGPPLWVRVETAGPHSLRVSWAPPTTAKGVPPTKYAVYYTDVETGREQTQWVDVDPSPSPPSLSTVVGGLRAAAQYWVRVGAAGGLPSTEHRARTAADVPSAAPHNVTAVSTASDTILVRWEAPPPRSHRGALTGYKLRYRPAPSPPSPGGGQSAAGAGPAPSPPTRRKADSLTTPADARKAELKGLETGTTYQIRVCAINANGSGPFSEWVTATTHSAPAHSDEATVPDQPPPLTTRAGRDWISVWWTDTEGLSRRSSVVRGYLLGWGLGVPDTRSEQLPGHQHSHVIRGLESNAEYVISLRASNARGLGPAVYATVRTKDGDGDDEDDPDIDEDGDGDDEDDGDELPPLIPPVGLKVIMLSGTTAVVYWTDPTLPKGQPATDGRIYVVRYSTVGSRPRVYNATDLNCMLDDLKPFTTYEFAVKLIKGGRSSAWSMLVSNTTLETAPGSAPRDLRVSHGAPPSRSADLTWSPPARPNGVITGYVIMYATARSESPLEWTAITVSGERGRARVDRLRPRTQYHFKVQASNSKGLGPFGPVVVYTTSMESNESGGLATATSAWLWASAGGACAVLALAAALALSLCCRRAQPPLSPDTSTYQKSSASAAIKPPDLWIHHDQMELKHMDKSLHSSAMSAGSTEGSALVSSSLALRPAADYEPARHHPPASLDRRHYVPTYVESGGSCASDDTCALRASPASLGGCYRCDYKPMTGVGVGSLSNMGTMGMSGTMTGLSGPMTGLSGTMPGCASTCDRRQHPRHMVIDQSSSLAGGGPLSPQSSLASLAPLHPPPAPCGSGTCPLGAACSAPQGVPGVVPVGVAATPGGGGDIYACAQRERGHYVAYEPLGHYTHRDSLASDSGPPGPPGGSLQRPRGGSTGPVTGPLHSFSDGSEHSTPAHSAHSARSVRDCSPYKKSSSNSSPGHAVNRLQLGGSVPHCPSELEPLTPSRSTERLQREMQNLEGLMKDLSAITTHHQFHC